MLRPLHVDGTAEAEGTQAAVAVGARPARPPGPCRPAGGRPGASGRRRRSSPGGTPSSPRRPRPSRRRPASRRTRHPRGRHRRSPRRGPARAPRGRGRPPPPPSWRGGAIGSPSWRAFLRRGLRSSWRPPWPASPSWSRPASSPPPWPSAPPSWGRRARGSRREPSRRHRRSPAGASDQRRGCAWPGSRMVETELSGPVPPHPHSGRARPRIHRLLAGVFSDAGAAQKAERGQAGAVRMRDRPRARIRPSASRCASTWFP